MQQPKIGKMHAADGNKAAASEEPAVLGLKARDWVPPAHQRAAANEINNARRLLKIGFAPVDLLYSESLTKSYQKY